MLTYDVITLKTMGLISQAQEIVIFFHLCLLRYTPCNLEPKPERIQEKRIFLIGYLQ